MTRTDYKSFSCVFDANTLTFATFLVSFNRPRWDLENDTKNVTNFKLFASKTHQKLLCNAVVIFRGRNIYKYLRPRSGHSSAHRTKLCIWKWITCLRDPASRPVASWPRMCRAPNARGNTPRPLTTNNANRNGTCRMRNTLKWEHNNVAHGI